MRLPSVFSSNSKAMFPSAGMTLLHGLPDWLLSRVKSDLTLPAEGGSRKASAEGEDDHIYLWQPHPEGVLVPRHYWRPDLSDYGVVQVLRGDVGDFDHVLQYGPLPRQVPVVEQIEAMGGDVGIQAPPAFGKTFLGFYFGARRRGRILVIAPNTNKMNEWRRDAGKFLGLRPDQIGVIQGPVCNWKPYPVVVAMAKTLSMRALPMDVQTAFDTVIADEVHTTNAAVISKCLGAAGGNRLALSATPGRGQRLRIIESHMGSRWIRPQVRRMPCRVEFLPVPMSRWLQKMEWTQLFSMWGRDDFYVDTAAGICAKLLEQGRRTLVLSNQTKPLGRVFFQLNERGGFVIGEESLRDMVDASGLVRQQVMATGESNWQKRTASYMEMVKKKLNPVLGTGMTKLQPAGTGMDIENLDGGVLMLPTGNVDTTTQIIGRFDREFDKQKPLIVVMVPYTSEGMRTAQAMQGHLRRMGGIEVFEHPPVGRNY